MEKHLFAVYYSDCQFWDKGTIFAVRETEIIHRVLDVLRLKRNEKIIFFNSESVITGELITISKKYLEFIVCKAEKPHVKTPEIIVGLPLLKKDAFEEALYSCVELGAARVIPFISEKVHRRTLETHDLIRAEKIMVAAAEQSKNFVVPQLEKVVSLKDIVSLTMPKIFFDVQGMPAQTVFAKFAGCEKLMILFGPEADLSIQEKLLLRQNECIFCALTSTILRAQQAVGIGLGLSTVLLAQND